MMMINFFGDYRSLWRVLHKVVTLGIGGAGASMTTSLASLQHLSRGAEDLIKFCAIIFRRPKSSSAHCATTFLILNP